MDPIHPITPGPLPVSQALRPAVPRLERITREGDRPSKDAQERQSRRRHEAELSSQPGEDEDPEDGGRPHVDVRA